MTPKNPFLVGTFWEKFWRPIRSRALLFTPEIISSLLRTENSLTTDIFVVKCTGRGLVVKRPGILSKVQMLNLVLGVGVSSLLYTLEVELQICLA